MFLSSNIQKLQELSMAGFSIAYNGGLGRGRNEGVFRLSVACGLGHVRRWHYLNSRLNAMLFACCGFCISSQTSAGHGPDISRQPESDRCKNAPLLMKNHLAKTLASGKARIFGHDYGLERSSKKKGPAITKTYTFYAIA